MTSLRSTLVLRGVLAAFTIVGSAHAGAPKFTCRYGTLKVVAGVHTGVGLMQPAPDRRVIGLRVPSHASGGAGLTAQRGRQRLRVRLEGGGGGGWLRGAAARRRTRPYTPRTNGKAEAFIGTALREWAYRYAYPTSLHRTRTLSGWVRWYNRRRPHTSLGNRPPISRVAQVRGHFI